VKRYPSPDAPQGASAKPPNSHSSRAIGRLLQAGLSSGPALLALLALKATPVRADNRKSPSGFSASGNLGRNTGGSSAVMGHTPLFWSTNLNTNGGYRGSPLITPTTLFSD